MKEFKPAQKVISFLEDYINSGTFQKKIIALRKEIGIPENGLPFIDKEKILKSEPNLFYNPPEIDKEKAKKVNLALRDILKDFPVLNMHAMRAFRLYFYYNDRLEEMFESAFSIDNMCRFIDANTEFYEFAAEDRELNDIYIDHQKGLVEKYPLALYIHPRATQRDIVEYVRVVWPLFKLYGKRHLDNSSKLGRLNKKNDFVTERNVFIYQNRHLPRKEIMRLLYDKYGEKLNIDYGYIGKIISLENKKRKEM